MESDRSEILVNFQVGHHFFFFLFFSSNSIEEAAALAGFPFWGGKITILLGDPAGPGSPWDEKTDLSLLLSPVLTSIWYPLPFVVWE